VDGQTDCADANCSAELACTSSGSSAGSGSSSFSRSIVSRNNANRAAEASRAAEERSAGEDVSGGVSEETSDAADAPVADGARDVRWADWTPPVGVPLALLDLDGDGVIEPAAGEGYLPGVAVPGATGPAGVSLDASLGCDPYLTATLGRGRLNPPAQVSKLQTILNALVSITLPVTGLFDEATESAVKAFQLEHEDVILRPWGEELCPGGVCQPTGVVGLTTRRFINKLVCGF
jgi:hypothetical protein